MSEDFQSDFASLAPGIASADEGFKAALEHGHDRFDLNAVSISVAVEPGLHNSTVVAAGGLGGGATVLSRDDGTNVAFASCERVIRLRIVTGVGDDALESHAFQRRCDERAKVGHVRLRTPIFSRGRMGAWKIKELIENSAAA